MMCLCVMHIYMFLGTKGIAQGADCMGLAEKVFFFNLLQDVSLQYQLLEERSRWLLLLNHIQLFP